MFREKLESASADTMHVNGRPQVRTGGRDTTLSNNEAQEPLLVVAVLTIVPGAADRFREFETMAARILARYGGVIDRTVTVEPSSSNEEREVHVLSFPSKEAFANYRLDAELASLAELRSSSIARTEILIGRAGPQYSEPAR
jgi:uncharacterized protein (DUF1330 family)